MQIEVLLFLINRNGNQVWKNWFLQDFLPCCPAWKEAFYLGILFRRLKFFYRFNIQIKKVNWIKVKFKSKADFLSQFSSQPRVLSSWILTEALSFAPALSFKTAMAFSVYSISLQIFVTASFSHYFMASWDWNFISRRRWPRPNVQRLCCCIFSTSSVRADLHRTIFVACDNGLRQAHDMIYNCCVRQRKCRSILNHVLKRCDNRKSCRRPVVSLSHATKIVPCKSALKILRSKISRNLRSFTLLFGRNLYFSICQSNLLLKSTDEIDFFITGLSNTIAK